MKIVFQNSFFGSAERFYKLVIVIRNKCFPRQKEGDQAFLKVKLPVANFYLFPNFNIFMNCRHACLMIKVFEIHFVTNESDNKFILLERCFDVILKMM